MKIIILAIMLILFGDVAADGFKSHDHARKFADSLIDKFKDENFSDGLNSAKPYWPIPEIEIDSLANDIEKQWTLISQRFGNSIGSEFILEEKIGESFVRYYYLHKFEKHAIYWNVDFYKPQNEWVINTITFRDKLDILYR